MWYLGYADGGFVGNAIGQMDSLDAEGAVWPASGTTIYRAEDGGWDSWLVTGPTVTQGPDGLWRLYYSGVGFIDAGVGLPPSVKNGVGLLTSIDGVHWEPEPGNPIFESAPGNWDDEILEQTVRYTDGHYWMWYSGWRGEVKPQTSIAIGLATSTDGVRWQRSAQNPVLTPGAQGSWNDLSVLAPEVLVEPDGSLLMAAYGKSRTDSAQEPGQLVFWRSR
jgi:hypothetical protein